MNASSIDDGTNIITLNNLGAQCMKMGDYKTAIKFLSSSFSLSKQQLHRHCTAAAAAASDESAMDRHSVTAIDTWMNRDYDYPSNENVSGKFVYRDPICVPEKGAYPNDLIVIPSVITFNLGLAYHLLATRTSRGGITEEITVKLLRQSLKLYQCSFRLQRARRKGGNSPFFFMATINNVGVVFSILGKTRDAKQCFQQLLSLLMYMKTAASVADMETTTSYNVSELFEAFFRNTCRSSSVCAGAA
jgi:tetratricopeptide (TPR) repeat protein